MLFGLSIAGLVSRLISFYELLIFVYVIMSWFRVREGILFDIYRVLASICEPYIGIFRRILPSAAVGGAGLDFSPLVAILVLSLVGQQLIVPMLRGLGL